MIVDSVNIVNLPLDTQEAFAKFEFQVREAYEDKSQTDRRQNSDQNGEYFGSYEPERSYVTAILAFLDEYSLETEIQDISELDNGDFNQQFGRFKSKVEYISIRYKLRRGRVDSGGVGTVISFAKSYKEDAGSLLEKIRKIINQEVDEGPKKEEIFKKISSLQSEIDRDLTTVDAAFGRILDLSRLLGNASGNLKPAVDQLERIKNIFWNNSEKVEQLPKPDRPKQISKEKLDPNGTASNMDDEIPF